MLPTRPLQLPAAPNPLQIPIQPYLQQQIRSIIRPPLFPFTHLKSQPLQVQHIHKLPYESCWMIGWQQDIQRRRKQPSLIVVCTNLLAHLCSRGVYQLWRCYSNLRKQPPSVTLSFETTSDGPRHIYQSPSESLVSRQKLTKR